MRLLVYTHPSFLLHSNGPNHPERPERLGAVMAGIAASGVEVVERSPSEASLEALELVHDGEYVRSIESYCRAGGGALDSDTGVVAASWEAARRAAGAGLDAVAALEADEGERAFLVVRPPGHHAGSRRAMGFCVFNNVAIAAAALLSRGHRVAIVDWDVHHGNGTQDMFYENPNVLYVSLHESPNYPGSGWFDEVGRGPGLGTTMNLPMPAGTRGDAYRMAINEMVVPALLRFHPDWLLVSCGFDAHESDPLAGVGLIASDYGAMSAAITAQVPRGRTVFFLEGGYNLEALRSSAAATVADAVTGPPSGSSPEASWRVLEAAARQFSAIGIVP